MRIAEETSFLARDMKGALRLREMSDIGTMSFLVLRAATEPRKMDRFFAAVAISKREIRCPSDR